MSDGVEWALHCATVLASLPEDNVLSAKDLAQFHGVSESYLLKHLKTLVKAKILESTPGPTGGFKLARPASEITLMDVVDAIEGRFTPFRCTEIRRRNPVADPSTDYRSPCFISVAMREAEQAYRKSLGSKTIADMSDHVLAFVPKGNLEASGKWLGERARAHRKGDQ
jgi:Rrf2 family protein